MDQLPALLLVGAILLALAVGVVLGHRWGVIQGHLQGRLQVHEEGREGDVAADGAQRAEIEARSADHAVVREGLERLQDQMRDLEHTRVTWQSQLHEQVEHMRHSTESLRRETSMLAGALRRPTVRGQWGELHLRRSVEVAGLVDRCDFAEQVPLHDGAQRPDVVVHLAGDRQVVIDAKVPLDAFLDATAIEGDSDTERAQRQTHLQRHARQVRAHVDHLGTKAYWRSLAATPEFVVLFVPADSFLSVALENDHTLIEYAAARQVVLASPTTLIALLRTVAQGWSQQALTAQAQEIQRLGRDLHHRLGTLNSHLDKAGRSLNSAVEHYNRAMGSLDSRVLVAARRFSDLGVTTDELPAPRSVELRTVGRGSYEEPIEDHTVAQ